MVASHDSQHEVKKVLERMANQAGSLWGSVSARIALLLDPQPW